MFNSVNANVNIQKSQLDPTQDSLPLLMFLNELGKNQNCYFTLEEGCCLSGEAANQIEALWITKSLTNEKLPKALAQLVKQFPRLTYSINNHNPSIIHLKETTLNNRKDYSLEKSIPRVKFKGTARELVPELRKLGVTVNFQGWGDIHEMRRLNLDYQFNFVASKLQVRDALCRFTDLKNHGRILWIARTDPNARADTYLFFYR